MVAAAVFEQRRKVQSFVVVAVVAALLLQRQLAISRMARRAYKVSKSRLGAHAVLAAGVTVGAATPATRRRLVPAGRRAR